MALMSSTQPKLFLFNPAFDETQYPWVLHIFPSGALERTHRGMPFTAKASLGCPFSGMSAWVDEVSAVAVFTTATAGSVGALVTTGATPVTTAVVAGRVSTGLSASLLYGKLLTIVSLAPHLLHVTVNTAVSFVAPFARMGSIRIFPAASGDFLF